jgi:hypothetical protein
VTDPLEHLAHLVGFPLADHDAPPGVHAARRRTQQRHLAGHDALPLDDRPFGQTPLVGLVGNTPNLGLVLPRHAELRMGQPLRQITVVGQQHQALGAVVQPSHRKHSLPRANANQVEDGLPALRVVGCGDNAHGLVEQNVAQDLIQLEALAVDLDRVVLRVGLVANLGNPTVDRHSTLANQVLGIAPGADPGARNQLL